MDKPNSHEISAKVRLVRMLKIVKPELGALMWGTLCLAISSGAQMAVCISIVSQTTLLFFPPLGSCLCWQYC